VPTRPDWFLDWTGAAVAIVASGPSTRADQCRTLEGRIPRTIAIKENIELCPWADVVYGCDPAWWRNAFGLPNFKGLRVAHKSPFSAVKQVKIDTQKDFLLTAEPGLIGCGGNSGFQSINLAVQFGAKRILLLGFDASDRGGVHWYGRANGDGRSNPGEWNFKRWRQSFENAATQAPGLGVEIINGSPLTALTCFQKMTVKDTLERWGL
jgi:hypothetical protein